MAGTELREGDLREPPPSARAVDARRFVQARVDALESGEQQQCDEGRAFPDIAQHDGHPCGERSREPVGVEDPADPAALEHEPPDERRNDRWQGPREQDDYACDSAASRQRIERQRERRPEDDLERHAHSGEGRGVHDGLPQPLIGQRGAVVVEPDERPPEPGHSQVVIVQRLPDCGQEGADRDPTEQEHCRQEQGPGETPVSTRC